MLHLCRTTNKLLILAVNQHPVRNGQKIAGDKSAFLCAFTIIIINKWLVQLSTVLNVATDDAHTV